MRRKDGFGLVRSISTSFSLWFRCNGNNDDFLLHRCTLFSFGVPVVVHAVLCAVCMYVHSPSMMKHDPLTTADNKAACTDNASDPPARPLIGSSAPDAHSKQADGEVISMPHGTLFRVQRCSDPTRTVHPMPQL